MQLGFTNISNFNNLADYVPILTAAILVDMLVSTISCVVFNTVQLKKWYKTFNLGADAIKCINSINRLLTYYFSTFSYIFSYLGVASNPTVSITL
jgi:hypothetical protein